MHLYVCICTRVCSNIYKHIFFLNNNVKAKNIINVPKGSKPVVDAVKFTPDKNRGSNELNHSFLLRI